MNMIFISKKINAWLVLALLAGALPACKSEPKEPATKAAAKTTAPTDVVLTDAQIKTGGIEVSAINTGAVNNTISLSGVIDVPPDNLVSITCPFGGYVQSIKVLPGQEVRKGEVLLVLQDPSFVQLQQDYLISRSKIAFLEKEYARQQTLSATEATSKKQFQQVSSELNIERVTLNGLSEKLKLIGINPGSLSTGNISRNISVRSPIHGFVSKTPINKGRYVSPTEILAELVDPSDIHAAFTVFEKDINAVKAGQRAIIKTAAAPGKEYLGEVVLVSHNIDENRSGMVHCHFHQYSRELVPGMAITGKLEVSGQNLPLVPEQAVVMNAGKYYVFREEGKNTFRLTEVTTGYKEGGMISLTNNNIDWANKKVVTKGAFGLLGTLLKEEE